MNEQLTLADAPTARRSGQEPKFQVGQIVKGHHFGRPIFEAEVLAVEGDDLRVRVYWGNTKTMGERLVPATWLEVVR
jgi:hypothetical protein